MRGPAAGSKVHLSRVEVLENTSWRISNAQWYSVYTAALSLEVSRNNNGNCKLSTTSNCELV